MDEIIFKKRDFWLAILSGELVAWLSWPVLKNLKILDILAGFGIGTFSFSVFWLLFIPAGAIFALYLFFLLARSKNRPGFFQLGKYGVVGVLNTFMDGGIFNLLVLITGIAAGWQAIGFRIVSFTVTIINSFFWNKFWTFKAGGEAGGQAVKFFFISTTVALINLGIFAVLINVIGAPFGIDIKIWANISIALTIITAFFGNFFGYKFIVFKK
ncbi:hypothetical protein A2833_00425 [Candidatus Azambacteria bacterium RIFCSPHIGHO2_01_FULL_44_55]|uniref:GtrA/DPMS transmembrane domain-containing protein n=1 Tax=Candidatus Azambacteria bacterium RIFCSPLOWO2_02_FULL_44_14 TaxID=1797306 RepID=A0A1F5CBT4_9BACT|nr:MAG: hypothetical protein A3A18_02155 [Candidatus Azambacteria bacterium RIFCSPLOWO2_01_FULL_44_84]OGD33198.1 MAG: hypothetical protein A3C78_02990 [Candidatus Azambacteria bacterium RIFCSPHIGHO2_02_FULL_45_18]OGD40303.1 MAG: hypothetical protein A3I30_03350 [Candidatus Azambacteria bacterium RIFCSPLOWO2_02_FULL_44_14]OGD40528.1 MAG: hypothetical protein A2833_00425 [Candidatus Azambacteria bacterium RIFCSPHIGHO2_01_FULL_44_55]